MVETTGTRIEELLAGLELLARDAIPGARSLSVQCVVQRTWHSDADHPGIARPRWVISAHMDPEPGSGRIAQGHGATFAEALADAEGRAAGLRGRCPACGRGPCDGAAHAGPAPAAEDEIEQARRLA
ncbi:MAG: hypothetical protein FJ087_21940 [Deltaproteobacteria bacterium]|nr:hypothetical protein [Deltaproteobacteria bacterium]